MFNPGVRNENFRRTCDKLIEQRQVFTVIQNLRDRNNAQRFCTGLPVFMDCMQFLFIEFYKSHFQRFSVLTRYISMLWKSPDSWKRFLKELTGFLKVC